MNCRENRKKFLKPNSTPPPVTAGTLYLSSARIRPAHRPARQIHGKYIYCDAIWRLVLTLLFTTHQAK